MKRKITGLILALIMLLTLGLAACNQTPANPPGASPATFGNLHINNTFMTVWNSVQSDIRLSFPATADTLVGRDTTDTLTNKTLTSPVITGTSVVSNRASGNITFVAGATSASFAHGMSSSPTRVWLQPRISIGTATSNITANPLWIYSISSTNVTIWSSVASNQTAQIDWFALIADE